MSATNAEDVAAVAEQQKRRGWPEQQQQRPRCASDSAAKARLHLFELADGEVRFFVVFIVVVVRVELVVVAV